MYENFGVKENIWCDILGFDQSEQMNIKLMLHSVWKFWQIAINSIAKKSLIWNGDRDTDSYPEIGNSSFRCALWTFKQQLTWKVRARCGISIVLL